MLLRSRGVVLLSALLLVPCLGACDEETGTGTELVPVVEGTIEGVVTIDGEGASGITVTLSDGQTVTTDASGRFRIQDVVEGAYSVTISGFPADATFPQTSKAAVIASSGAVITVDFAGSFIRYPIGGRVRVSGTGIGGVTVTLSGAASSTTTTATDGSYSFPDLRGGNYTVTISNISADVQFEVTSQEVLMQFGGATADFDGQPVPGAIGGTVTVDGVGRSGATLTVVHAGSGEVAATATTAADGSYSAAGLQPGAYTVQLTGLAADVVCDANSVDVTVTGGSTATADFVCRGGFVSILTQLDFTDIPPATGVVAPGTYTVDVLDAVTGAKVGVMDVATEGPAGSHFKDANPTRIGVAGPAGWVLDLGSLTVDAGTNARVEEVRPCFTGSSGFSADRPLVVEERSQTSVPGDRSEIANPAEGDGCRVVTPSAAAFFMAFMLPDQAVMDLGAITMYIGFLRR